MDKELLLSIYTKTAALILWLLSLFFCISIFFIFRDGVFPVVIAIVSASISSVQFVLPKFLWLGKKNFRIESLFGETIEKNIDKFVDFKNQLIFPLPLFRIKFKDGETYLFLGQNEEKLNRLIKEKLRS
jgi:hypothetical protein